MWEMSAGQGGTSRTRAASLKVPNESSQRAHPSAWAWPGHDPHPGGWHQGSLVPETQPQRQEAQMESRGREAVQIGLGPLSFPQGTRAQ